MSMLILTLDDDLLQQAAAYARRTNPVQVVAQALRPLVQPPVAEPAAFSLQVAALLGCLSLPADYD